MTYDDLEDRYDELIVALNEAQAIDNPKEIKRIEKQLANLREQMAELF